MLDDFGKGQLQLGRRFAQAAPMVHRDIDWLCATQNRVDEGSFWRTAPIVLGRGQAIGL